MGSFGQFVFDVIIVIGVLWYLKNLIEKKDAQRREKERQNELARGRAIKKWMKEEEELARYRRGDFSDDEEEDEEEEEDIE